MQGAWIEMLEDLTDLVTPERRSPCGERGLKLESGADKNRAARSLPLRGAWIEI